MRLLARHDGIHTCSSDKVHRDMRKALGAWDTDLTMEEVQRLGNAIARCDHLNWDADSLAVMLAGTVRAIAAARLAEVE